VVNHLVPLGFAVYGFDHRGHGRSPGKRGHIMGWNEFREDVKQFVDKIHQEGADKPLFLYGHSMGGLIVLDYVLHYPEGLSGVIASGPILAQPGVSPFLLMLSRILSKIWPSFSIDTKLDADAISRDPEVIKAYEADPLVHSMASARFGTELTATMEWTHDHAFELKIPLLILHGEADKLVPPAGSRKFFENVNLNDKELQTYPGGYHEPHNDIEHQTVLNDLERWLQKHL
jgi:alpha-beta hydrolase superfamily lysophospholipase